MRTFLVFLLVFEAFFLLKGTGKYLSLAFLNVDFIGLLVLYVGFFIPVFPGAVWIFLIGLAQESLGAPLHGAVILSYLIVFFFLRMTHRQLLFQGGITQMIWVVLLSLAFRGIEAGLLIWQGYPLSFNILWYVPAAFIQALVSLILFPFLQNGGRINGKSSRKEQGKVSLRHSW